MQTLPVPKLMAEYDEVYLTAQNSAWAWLKVLMDASGFFQKLQSCLESIWDKLRDPLTFHTRTEF